MRTAILVLALALGGICSAQYNGLTTIYKLPQYDVLVNLENYNEHYLRQELADKVFCIYADHLDKNSPINLKNFIVEGELTVQQLSAKTVVLFYRCKRFTIKQ